MENFFDVFLSKEELKTFWFHKSGNVKSTSIYFANLCNIDNKNLIREIITRRFPKNLTRKTHGQPMFGHSRMFYLKGSSMNIFDIALSMFLMVDGCFRF